MPDVITRNYEVTINVKRGTLQPDDLRRISVEVRVDLEGIAKELGRKAYSSARNRSIEIGGLVRVVYVCTLDAPQKKGAGDATA